MEAAAASCTSFEPFARLPTELRIIIWRESLPEKDEPALFFYKEGRWRTKPSGEQIDPNDDKRYVVMYFSYDLLDNVEINKVNIPLLFVNFEARNIALAWARQQGYRMSFCECRQSHVLVRLFDLMRDVFYVPHDKWDAFLTEDVFYMWREDLRGRFIDRNCDFRRLALSATVIEDRKMILADLLYQCHGLEVLFIIVEPLPNLGKKVKDKDVKEHQRWEVKGKEEKAFIWDTVHGRFDSNRETWVDDEALYSLIQEVNAESLNGGFTEPEPGFKIQPAIAVGN
jgi:2EXR family